MKLRRLLCYVKGTINETAFIGADNLHTMITPVDNSYAPHDDFKSHTGGASTHVIGMTSSKSSKQKSNTTSSTEAELVGVADCSLKTLSRQLLMKAQGCLLKHDATLQEDKSDVLMENNGKKSCAKRTRHLSILCFHVKHLIDRKEVEVDYFPTENMLAIFFSKPLQGNSLRRFRSIALGYQPLHVPCSHEPMCESKKRVECHESAGNN